MSRLPSKDLVIRPVCGRVLLQVVPPPVKAGDIHLVPGALRHQFREALVKALPDPYYGDLSVGDRVMLPPYPDREIRLNGDTLVFVREADLPAALE
jgi:co-chaperonin GroES (HSP10)